MGEGETTEWPDDDADPFSTVDSEPSDSTEEDVESSEPIEQLPENDTVEDDATEKVAEEMPLVDLQHDGWTLPIRAAPLLHQFHDEIVTEYPLQQTVDGRKTTSLVLDEDLLRIIESRLDDDGQRRLKVSLSMKREITGFKHQHNELMHKHQFLWLGSALLGTLFLLSSLTVFNFIGVLLVSAGVWNWSNMHLESHHLEFTNSGGTLSHTLRGYGTNRPFFRASMALLGSEMAGLLRNGELETEALENLHAALSAPPPKVEPLQIQQKQPVQIEQLPAPMQIPAPPQTIPTQPMLMAGPPTAAPKPLPAPISPPPIVTPVAPLPPPPAPMPAAPLPLPPAAVPAAPLPPINPLPPLNGSGGMPLPLPLGLPDGPIPLDAPLPNAPEIAVKASPVEDTLSEEEQSDLLNELS
mgnify:CR=1 FL=1